MSELVNISEALIAVEEDKLMALVKAALAGGTPAVDILNDALLPAMDVIGEKMEKGDMFIPEVLMAAGVMSTALDEIKPLLATGEGSNLGSVVIGTVKGDLHDIGKNLVAMMLESAGLEVHNVGVDIAPEEFVEKVKTLKPKILCLSALLTTTMPMMKETVDAVVESGVRGDVKIMVGGAPVTQAFADEIGADGFAPDAGSAVRMAKAMAA